MPKAWPPIERFKKALGVFSPSDTTPTNRPVNISNLSRFTDNELNTLIRRTYTKRENPATGHQLPDITGLISYLRPEHEDIARVIQDSERFKALTPEIEQAESILVSSILSPNDLQDTAPTFTIDNVPDLNGEISDKIVELLDAYFNGQLKLGQMAADWCSESMFRSGAKPILILPEKMLSATLHDGVLPGTDTDNTSGDKVSKSTESFSVSQETPIPTTREQLEAQCWNKLKEPIYSGTHSAYENFSKVWEKNTVVRDRYTSSVLNAVLKDVPDKNFQDNKVKASLEGITVRFATELEEGDVLKISENPEIMRFGKIQKNKGKQNITKKLNSMYMSSDASDKIVSLLDGMDVPGKTIGHPFVLELPTESVIPVMVPGSKKERLGYFVLVDVFGQPVEASKYLLNRNNTAYSGNASAAYTALFQGSGTSPGSIAQLPTSLTTFGNPWDMRKHVLTRVFDHVLDTVLKKKLEGMGLHDVDVARMNTVAACMFYRFLENKRTSLVFVPESLITYVCFDQRDNGTGKSKLEDVAFLLSLRLTLMVAAIMSMTRAAIEHKRIEIQMDEKTASPEQLMSQVNDIFAMKYKMRFHTDPDCVANDIIRQNTSIVPKGLPGLSNFEVNQESSTSNAIKADTDLLDILTNMIITKFDVPHSAYNQLSETEYSRSIATTNLFFSKKIKNFQIILCGFMEQFVKTYLIYSAPLLAKIQNILKGTDGRADKVDPAIVTPDTHGNPQNDDGGKLLRDIIDNIKISLPSPNISPDKSQFTEIREFMEMANTLFDGIYPAEMIDSEDENATKALPVLKALMKSRYVKEFIAKIGTTGNFNFEAIEDFIISNEKEMQNLNRALRNFQMGVIKDKASQKPVVASDGEGTGDDEYGSSSSDTGYNY